jgi:hypothetical protein
VRKLNWIFLGLLFAGLLESMARAEIFQLNDGRAVTGELLSASANDAGVQVRLEDGKYERVPWGNFSQDDLKKFVADKKMEVFVRPLIEESPEERIKKTEIELKKDYPRLARPQQRSLLGALLSSALGLVLLLILYAATIYAAMQVALYRKRPVALVVGLAAIPLIGFLSPILFLCLPTQHVAAESQAEAVLPPERKFEVASEPEAPAAPPPSGAAARTTSSIKSVIQSATSAILGSDEPSVPAAPAPVQPAAALPPTQVFQRGAFMFNRRFFETKFPGFFAATRPEADRDSLLLIKSVRGDFSVERITRISASDALIEVVKENAIEEILLPFTEIKEIQLKHKNA